MNTTKLEEGYATAMEWLRENEGKEWGKVYSSGKVAKEYKVDQVTLIDLFNLREGETLQPSIKDKVQGSPFDLLLSIEEGVGYVSHYDEMSEKKNVAPIYLAQAHIQYNIAMAEVWYMDKFLTIWLKPEGFKLVGSVQDGGWAIVEDNR